jgi:hypothetical protein
MEETVTGDLPMYVLVFIFVLASVSLLQLGRFVLSRYTLWDAGEKSRTLQENIRSLQTELDKAQKRVVTLEEQIELLITQYNNAIVQVNNFKNLYEAAVADTKSLRDELNELRRDLPSPEITSPRRRVLIAAVGTRGLGLELDLASLRAVQMATGLEFERVLDSDPEKLKKVLDRARMQRYQTYLHLAIRADKDGYQLGNEIVDAEWMSSVLGGVLIIVVAGAESDWVGDLLGVVPYVITMSEGVAPRDAAAFARAFWTEVGNGLGPQRALNLALQRSPATMREYVVRHWSD